MVLIRLSIFYLEGGMRGRRVDWRPPTRGVNGGEGLGCTYLPVTVATGKWSPPIDSLLACVINGYVMWLGPFLINTVINTTPARTDVYLKRMVVKCM